MDYLTYAYLQTAKDEAAKRVVDEARGFRKGAPAHLVMVYALAAIPVRYVLERRDWAAAASLTPVGADVPWERFPWAAAMTVFARALGAAQTGDLPAAEHELATLQSLKDNLVAAKNTYWANQVEVQRLGAAAVLAQAQGDGPRALELSSAAVVLEQSMDKHPATPGSVLPAGELRGDLLLERNDAAGALTEYQAVLRADPNRFRSVLGTARAARFAGDSVKAKEAYQQLVTLCAQADTERPELVEARRFVGE
jgi:tetratricopeptide (TPR) repeat protein